MKALEIIKEADAWVAINKPAGLRAIPDRYDASLPNAFGLLKNQLAELYTVHRIDKDTSGILLFAKTAIAHKHLNDQFQNRKIEKFYWALVQGIVAADEDTIDFPIAHHPTKQGVMIATRHGKESKTGFRIIKRFQNCTLLEVELFSGRTHQIRVHMQAYGHPLLVDAVYGGKEGFLLSSVKRKYRRPTEEVEKPLMSRQTLHARKLSFIDPVTSALITLEAELPKDFKAVIKQLEKLQTKG